MTTKNNLLARSARWKAVSLGIPLGLGLLWPLAPNRAAAQGKLEAQYEATLAGIPVGRGAWNIEINEDLIRKARKLTRLKTKRQIVDRALELLVRSESRKGILHYYGTGIWKGDLKASRRDRV